MKARKEPTKGSILILLITSLIIYSLLMVILAKQFRGSYRLLDVLLLILSLCSFIFGFLVTIAPKGFYNIIYKLFRKSLEEGYYQMNAMKYDNNSFYFESNLFFFNLSYILIILPLLG